MTNNLQYSDISQINPKYSGTYRVDHRLCLPTRNTIQISVSADGTLFAYCHRCNATISGSLGYTTKQRPQVATQPGQLYPDLDPSLWPSDVQMFYEQYDILPTTLQAIGWMYVPHYSTHTNQYNKPWTMAPRLFLPLLTSDKYSAGYMARNVHDYDKQSKVTMLSTGPPWLVSDFRDNKVVLVEDAMSFSKCYQARISAACLFGTTLPQNILEYTLRSRKHIIIFLDNDSVIVKQKQNKINDALGLITSTRIVYSDRDPKQIDEEELHRLCY